MATLTEIDISESRKVFDSCDRNGDGFIDTAEFHVLLEQLDGDVTAPSVSSISKPPIRKATATSASRSSSPGGRTSDPA